MTERLGDGPIAPEYHKMMNDVARALDCAFNGDAKGNARKTGFVLMVYPFAEFDNGDSRCNYISNGADRGDVVTLMKEMIARFEGQPEQKGKA
jgi:hypothetical protein